jgi:hypothetical protein
MELRLQQRMEQRLGAEAGAEAGAIGEHKRKRDRKIGVFQLAVLYSGLIHTPSKCQDSKRPDSKRPDSKCPNSKCTGCKTSRIQNIQIKNVHNTERPRYRTLRIQNAQDAKHPGFKMSSFIILKYLF